MKTAYDIYAYRKLHLYKVDKFLYQYGIVTHAVINWNAEPLHNYTYFYFYYN